MSAPLRCLPAFILFLGVVAGAAAQTTGGIVGRVTDDGGGSLPGVTVEATSPALQGTRTAVTDRTGSYRLTLLPPGEYTVSFTLEGFARDSRQGVAVGLGKDATLNATLRASALAGDHRHQRRAGDRHDHLHPRHEPRRPRDRDAADRRATTPRSCRSRPASPPTPTRTNTAAVDDHRLRLDRRRERVLHRRREHDRRRVRLPGQGAQLRVHPGGGRQDRRLRGRVRPLDRRHHQRHHQVGRQRVPRRRLRLLRQRLAAGERRDGRLDRRHARPASPARTTASTSAATSSGTGSGSSPPTTGWTTPTDTILPAGPLAGDVVQSKSERDLGSAKLTWNAHRRASRSSALLPGPARRHRRDQRRPAHAQRRSAHLPRACAGFGGTRLRAALRGHPLGATGVLTGQVARHQEENSVGPATAAGDAVAVPRRRATTSSRPAASACMQTKDFERDFAGASATRYLGATRSRAASSTSRSRPTSSSRMSGGQQVDVFANDAIRPADLQPLLLDDADGDVANAPVSQLNASPEHKNTTAYLQDRWTVDAQPHASTSACAGTASRSSTPRATRQIDLKKDFAPRLGFVWDPAANGTLEGLRLLRPLLRADPDGPGHPLVLLRAAGAHHQLQPDEHHARPGAEADLEHDSTILGGFTEPADPDLQQPVHQRVPPRLRARGACRTWRSASRASTATTAR